MKQERYVVVDDTTPNGNSVWFWAWDESMTCDLRQARIFTHTEGYEVTRTRRKAKLLKYTDCLRLVQLHVKAKGLRKPPKFMLDTPTEDMLKARWVVQDSRTKCGESAFFWCWDAGGYTCDLRFVAHYDYKEALRMQRGRGTDLMVRYDDCMKRAEWHVDCQDLYASNEPPRTAAHTYSHMEVRKPL